MTMITCNNCGKKITDPKDVNVLAMFGVVPRTFCNGCYSSKERGFARHILYWPKQPINGTLFIVRFAFLALIWLAVLAYALVSKTSGSWMIAALFSLIVLWYFLLWRSARNTVKKVEAAASKK